MQTFDVANVTSPDNLSLLFKLSMWWRIFYGVLRILVGGALLRYVGDSLADPIYELMSHEFAWKTGDVVLEKIYNTFVAHDFTVTYFIACYFIFWGLVDIVLSFCLLRHIVQAFPITMFLIVLFIIYGIFRLIYTHSFILFCVIILDIVILYLINIEYKKFKLKEST